MPPAATSSSTPRRPATRRSAPIPSYAGQVVVMTYPLIGNYGRVADDDQSMRPWLRALVVANATAAVLDDVRQLASLLRDERDPGDRGRGHASAGAPPARERQPAGDRHRARVRRIATPPWSGPGPCRAGRTRTSSARSRRRRSRTSAAASDGGPLVGIVDFGLKSNIVRGDAPARRPGPDPAAHDLDRRSPWRRDIDGADPLAGSRRSGPAGGPVALARAAIDDGRPLLGICLGHQIVARAAGAETTRLRFGHHGANHPVRDVDLGLVQVTAQNHEVQVVGDSLPAGSGFHVSQVNLNDGSVEGLRHATLPIETVQYHPEGAPGPLDALAVFDRFVAATRAARRPGDHRGDGSRRPAGRAPKPASVLILGSGPVVIGQAAEFDYAGTQACRALRARGRPDDPREQQPGDDHDRPGRRRRDLPRAADRRRDRGGDRAGAAGGAPRRARRPDRPQPGDGAVARPACSSAHDVRLLGTPLEAIRMAEDREAFRDLLDRIGQPYAPSAIVEGATDAGRAQSSADAALAEIGLPAIVRPAFTLGGTGGGIVETEEAYRERIRAGLRASPIGQVMVEKCLVGWQEIEYEVMRDADDTCIAVCSMENVDPLGVHTGDSIVVAPVQTLPDPVHQRLRSAALAIIRALGVEGGCNVQFALSPDSTRVRGHRGQPARVALVGPREQGDRLPDRPRRGPDRDRADGSPRSRTSSPARPSRRSSRPSTTSSSSCRASRSTSSRPPTGRLGSQMKATGEVMAIDRTFGAALNKALRGLEQAGAGPLAEDPSWTPTLRLPRRGLRRRRREDGDEDEDADDQPIRWVDETGAACESTRSRPALRRADRPARASSRRPTRACGGSSGCSAAASPRQTIQEATGIAPWFLAEMGRNVALEAEVRATRARLADRRDEPDGEAATLLATAKRAGFGDRELATLAGDPRRRTCATPRARARPPARLRDGRHVRRRVRRRDAVLLRDVRRGGLGAGGAAGRPPGGPRHRQRAGPDRAGDRVRLLRGAGRRDAPRAAAGRR